MLPLASKVAGNVHLTLEKKAKGVLFFAKTE
jgi:hypothetical protein